MPVSYSIQSDQGYVLSIYEGEVTLSQVLEMFQSYKAEPGFDLRLAHLSDLSRLKGSDVGFSEIFSLFSHYARIYSEAGQTMHTAIYAPDETVFGLSRIFENLAETSHAIEARLFDDLESARTWASNILTAPAKPGAAV